MLARGTKHVVFVGTKFSGEDIADFMDRRLRDAGDGGCSTEGFVSSMTWNPGPDYVYTMWYGLLWQDCAWIQKSVC